MLRLVQIIVVGNREYFILHLYRLRYRYHVVHAGEKRSQQAELGDPVVAVLQAVKFAAGLVEDLKPFCLVGHRRQIFEFGGLDFSANDEDVELEAELKYFIS